MAQPKRDTEHGRPTVDRADVISFEKAIHERPRKTEVPVELFLLSADGKDEMGGLYETIDASDRIIQALNIEIGETLGDMVRDDDPNIYSLLLHDDGGEALTRLELIDLYRENPLINTTMSASHEKHREKDPQAQQLYALGLRIFMNMVRYEWLTRTYNAADPRWADRAARLGDIKGTELHVYLNPGAKRRVIIPRHNTPSDYLDQTLSGDLNDFTT